MEQSLNISIYLVYYQRESNRSIKKRSKIFITTHAFYEVQEYIDMLKSIQDVFKKKQYTV